MKTHRWSLSAVAAAAALLGGGLTLTSACRVYVDRPAAAQPYPPAPPATTYYASTQTSPPPPPRRYYVRRPAPPAAQTASTDAPAPPTPNPNAGTTTLALNSGPAGSTCFDTAASPVADCAQMHTAAGCTYTQQKCAAYKAYFDPKVAAAAVTCLGSIAQKCDTGATNACGRLALNKACPDSTLTDLCQIAATSCKSAQADCTSLLSGLNDDGKEKVASCIAKGCAAGLGACVDALVPAHP
jgi:hypothetical protein